ncbi:unnamed protein product [Amaranthus hypochondriacus]
MAYSCGSSYFQAENEAEFSYNSMGHKAHNSLIGLGNSMGHNPIAGYGMGHAGSGYGMGHAGSGYGMGHAGSGYGMGHASSGYGMGHASSGYGMGHASSGYGMGLNHEMGLHYGGGQMGSSSYSMSQESSQESSFYSSKNSYNPCKRFF